MKTHMKTYITVYIPFLLSDLDDLDTMTLNTNFWVCIRIPKMKFLGQNFQKLEQIDRQTRTNSTERITTAAFAGGKNFLSQSRVELVSSWHYELL